MELEKFIPRDELENNLFSLLAKENLDDKSKEKYKKYFVRVSNDEFIEKLPYDRITKFIYNKRIYDTSVIDQIVAELIEYIRSDEDVSEDSKNNAENCLEKITRHIHLALVQYEFIVQNIEEKQYSINELGYKLYEAESKMENLTRDLDNKVSEVEKSINGNQLAILSIFAGIVTTFIGGFGVSINVFSNLVNNVPLPKIVAISSFLFIGIACLVFLLLATAARVVGHYAFFENNNRTLFFVIRLLALLCLGSVLIYQLEFPQSSPEMVSQGIWFGQTAKWIEIVITIIMIIGVIIPKPIFLIYRWIGNKIKD